MSFSAWNWFYYCLCQSHQIINSCDGSSLRLDLGLAHGRLTLKRSARAQHLQAQVWSWAGPSSTWFIGLTHCQSIVFRNTYRKFYPLSNIILVVFIEFTIDNDVGYRGYPLVKSKSRQVFFIWQTMIVVVPTIVSFDTKKGHVISCIFKSTYILKYIHTKYETRPNYTILLFSFDMKFKDTIEIVFLHYKDRKKSGHNVSV